MSKFCFTACVEIKELLGKKADDVQLLLELIEEVSLDSIYYHMHSCFLRHYYIAGVYPNDFATWCVVQLRDRVLGEKLAQISSSGYRDIEDIRQKLIETIDDHLTQIKIIPQVVYGEPFYFMQSRIVEVPTGICVDNLSDFCEALKTIDASAIYNHIYEAKLRTRKGRSDFAIWIEDVLNMQSLARSIEVIDCYMYSLEGLRSKLIELCTREMMP